MYTPADTLLLQRAGRLVVRGEPGATRVPEAWLQALDVDVAALGFVLSHRARRALGALTTDDLVKSRAWLLAALAAFVGVQKHEPLFRKFPHDVPRDTHELWRKKFLGFYFQTTEQPCLWCESIGTTHVLSCGHVVCSKCHDGSNYSACPVCEQPVDRSSPFFQPSPPRKELGPSPVALRRIDLAGDPTEEARVLLVSFVNRAQAMSPTDVTALTTIVAQHGEAVLPWLPATIPVRQNVANVFGTLCRRLPAVEVLKYAAPHLRTATDMLRLLAVWAGASAALEPTTRRIPVQVGDTKRWKGEPRKLAELGIGALPEWYRKHARQYPQYVQHWLATNITSERFKPPKMPRPARRAVLAWLDALPEAALAEDMPRHGSAWVRMGEALHPGEYATRHPRAAAAFARLRSGAPSGGFAATAERLRHAGDTPALVGHLRTRPGELWRRADDTLRHAADPSPVVAALRDTVSAASLPLLLQVANQLPRRHAKWPVRVYFPAAAYFVAPSTYDKRARLSPDVTSPLVETIERELLARFARLPSFEHAVLDEAIRKVVVPFNERTAARAAIVLPRGSQVVVPEADLVRLFLHWCEPESGETTDIDLSVGFYDKDWNHTGVCSYYSLNLAPTAVHSGDFQAAPAPDGASEFVDVNRAAALAAGHRYAVMVVNAYSGLPFGKLARGFAGVMRRSSQDGPTFDPQTVELRFDVAGDEHGVYVPLVLDLQTGTLAWVDVCSKGEIAFNNVASSNRVITRIVPALLDYFGHGARPSMLDLAQLHAAARAREVYVRGEVTRRYVRGVDDAPTFLARLRRGEGAIVDAVPPLEHPTLAMLLRGDLDLPGGSTAWALFREQLTGVVSASDLLSVPVS
jgi:hypothetical protein